MPDGIKFVRNNTTNRKDLVVMEIFSLTLSQMLMMFTLILAGFLLRKARILPNDSDVTMSRLETYIFLPALNLFNMMTNCTVNTFKSNSVLILYGLLLIIFAVALAYPLSKLFIRNSSESAELDYQRNIYKYAMTFGNYGFVGNFIVLKIWGGEGLFKYQMLTLCVSLVCSSWGLYTLIPKNRGDRSLSKNLIKGLTAPPMIALVLGVICGLLNIKQYFPDFALNALSSASNCMGPVAMVLAGFVIGGYEFKNLFLNKKVYIATALRLIIIPSVMILVMKALGINKEVLTFALIAFATPLGLNTIVYPAAYGGDTKTGASMAMISHALSVITLPLMYLLLIEII